MIEDKFVVEIKSVESLTDIHLVQILTYLKLSNCKLWLLINFNTLLFKDGVKELSMELCELCVILCALCG